MKHCLAYGLLPAPALHLPVPLTANLCKPPAPCSTSHVPRPGHLVRMPLSARPSLGGSAAEALDGLLVPDPAVRRLQSVNRSLDSQDTRARR